jgi:S-formylglutathione hydrolase
VTAAVETISEQRCFDGVQGFYRHPSAAAGGPMRFGVFVPERATRAPRPALYYLAGLECNEQTFAMKAGAQRAAAQLGLVLVTCDTSPRGARFPGDDASWDFGQSASFYVDATEEPWRQAYRMETYVTTELPAVVEASFPVLAGARGLFGHSMGGHGALALALRNPDRYRSVSAFAPIVAPSRVPWGRKAFTGYLGPDEAAWAAYDACALVRARPLRSRCSSTRGRRTSSSTCSSSPSCSRRRAPTPGSGCSCGATPATITATTSSRRSSRSISRTTRAR